MIKNDRVTMFSKFIPNLNVKSKVCGTVTVISAVILLLYGLQAGGRAAAHCNSNSGGTQTRLIHLLLKMK